MSLLSNVSVLLSASIQLFHNSGILWIIKYHRDKIISLNFWRYNKIVRNYEIILIKNGGKHGKMVKKTTCFAAVILFHHNELKQNIFPPQIVT